MSFAGYALTLMNDALEPPLPRKHAARALFVFTAAVGAAAAIGVATGGGKSPWYRSLRKPKGEPPAAAFAPVWTTLFGLIATSGWRIWRAPDSHARSRALNLWATQLVLNGAWTPLFFGAHAKKLALADSVALLLSIGAYIHEARKADPAAAWLVVPYAGWVSYATYLNAGIVVRND